MYNTIDECREDPMLRNLSTLLQNTNIHGGFVEYEKDKGFVDSGIYFVATAGSITDMHLDSKNPADIQRKIDGDPSTFYPYEFAIKITDADPLTAFDRIADFCHKAEMLNVYFGLEGVKVPDEMSMDDVNGLRLIVANSRNSQIAGDMRECVRAEMKKAIRAYNKEQKKIGFADKISSKFKSKEQQITDFIREHKQVNYETVDENQLEDFIQYLKKRDPELEYVLSDRIDVNTGIDKQEDGAYDPYGYAARNHSYREVYFKRADENIFHDALNHINYSQKYGKGHSIGLAALSKQGPVCTVDIPVNYMWLVDQCLTKWEVPYAIDDGYLNKSNTKTIPILYLAKDKNIISGMSKDLCDRYANESFVHAADKIQYNEQRQEQERKQKKSREFAFAR
ncbi:MAG: hypothetical protein UIM53_03250 [Acutalibacteraceae bacterium]|nr:hypothetical protein [Acutalibacteraceae bacterium]